MRWIGLCSLLLACAHDKAAPAPANSAPPPPVAAPAPAPPPKAAIRLFTDAEIDASIATVLARLAENTKRSCPAPKLLGDVTPGASAPELVALIEDQGPLAACLARLDKVTREQFLDRAPEALAVDKDCAEPIFAAVHRAGAFDQGCSPYQLGVRVDPKSLMRPLSIARLLALRAANVEKPAAGINMLVDVIRMAQDLSRGHATLVASMIAVATTEIAGAQLDALLDTAKLVPAQLENLAGALDRLIAAVPTAHDLLEGEREAQDLYALAMIEPADWIPPGGIGDFRPDRGTGKHVADPRDEGAAMLAAAELNAADRASVCPENATLEACRTGLGRVKSRSTATDLDLDGLWKQGQTDEPGMRMRMRQQIIEILAAVGSPNFGPYIEKQMGLVQRLVELRIHVEMLRTHKCPPAYAPPASLGKPLDVHVEKRVVTVEKWQIKCR